MPQERIGVLAVALLLVGGLAQAAGNGAEPRSVAHITYKTGDSVYIDAGREQGVIVGSILSVVQDGEVIATLEVAYVSSGKASCKLLETIRPPAVGDQVTFVAAPLPEPTPAEVAGPKPAQVRPNRPTTLRSRGIRGRVGVRYLQVSDRSGGAADYTQPSMDLRLDATQINGSPYGLNVDVRSRRTLRTNSDGSANDDSRTRVYRAAVTRLGVADPYNFTAGRQYSPALSAISVFDGISAERRKPRWSVGMFSGTQPSVQDSGYATDVREHGIYVQAFARKDKKRRWALTTGLIGSYEQSEINREFLYIQGRLTGPKLFGYFTQEVDYNRGWKQEAGESAVDPTNTFASLNYRAHARITLNAGYDSRRNIRLYRNLITPETDFDDSFRQGIWGGATAQLSKRAAVSVSTRTHRGGTGGDSNTYSVTGSLRGLSPARVDLRLRASRYDNDLVEGDLYSVTAGIHLAKRTRLQIGGGVRSETNIGGPLADETLNWLSFDVDVGLGKRWYLLFSGDRTSGDSEETDQYFTSLSYRF